MASINIVSGHQVLSRSSVYCAKVVNWVSNSFDTPIPWVCSRRIYILFILLCIFTGIFMQFYCIVFFSVHIAIHVCGTPTFDLFTTIFRQVMFTFHLVFTVFISLSISFLCRLRIISMVNKETLKKCFHAMTVMVWCRNYSNWLQRNGGKASANQRSAMCH